jgi:glycosyltransferase involved in cell wall biosynthesis
MRIAFITSEFVTEENFSGGLANYLSRIVVALREAGHEVLVLTRSTKSGTVEYRAIQVHRVVPTWGIFAGVKLDGFDRFAPKAFYGQYQDLKAAWCLWRHWRKLRACGEKFDIVQIANVCAVGLFFRRESPVAIVARLSSYRPVWDRLALPKIKWSDRLRWFLESSSIRGRRHIYAPSRYVSELWLKHEGVTGVKVIPTPFVPPAGPSDPTLLREIGEGMPYLLFFGRMNGLKGVNLLADALPAVLTRHPDWRAIFLGNDGAAPGGGSMQAYVRDRLAGFGDRVIIRNAVPSAQLLPVVAAARLVVLPSLADNIPNAGLESIFMGRPIMAFRGSCFEEMIEDGHTGFLVNEPTAAALADALNITLSLPATRLEEVGHNARISSHRWHPDSILPQVLSYYAEVLAEQQSGSAV